MVLVICYPAGHACLPERADVFQMRLGFGLDRLGHRVQHVCRFVDLLPGRRLTVNAGLHLTANGLRRNLPRGDQAQHILVAPCVCPPPFTHASMRCRATGSDLHANHERRADNHQHTLTIFAHARAEVDAVCPDIHIGRADRSRLDPRSQSSHQSAFSRVMVLADRPGHPAPEEQPKLWRNRRSKCPSGKAMAAIPRPTLRAAPSHRCQQRLPGNG